MTNYIKLAKDRYKSAPLNKKRITLKTVNKAIHAEFPDISLVKGEGYFYLIPDNDKGLELIGSHPSTSIYVYKLNELTVEQWLEDVRAVIKRTR